MTSQASSIYVPETYLMALLTGNWEGLLSVGVVLGVGLYHFTLLVRLFRKTMSPVPTAIHLLLLFTPVVVLFLFASVFVSIGAADDLSILASQGVQTFYLVKALQQTAMIAFITFGLFLLNLIMTYRVLTTQMTETRLPGATTK